MKRIFVAMLFAVCACSVQAQTFLSADLSAGYTHSTRNQGTGWTQPQGYSLLGGVKGGYAWNDALRAGVSLGMQYDNTNAYNRLYNPDSQELEDASQSHVTRLGCSGGFFMRTRIAKAGSFSFHLEYSVGYGWNRQIEQVTQPRTVANYSTKVVIDYKTVTRTFAARVVPVVSHAFTPHWSMDVYLDAVSLLLSHETRVVWKGKEENYKGEELIDYTATTTRLQADLLSRDARLLSFGLTYSF